MDSMLSKFQQTQLWEGWLGAETRANYFADLCACFQHRQNVLTWITLLASSGAVVTFLSGAPNWYKATLALVVAGISIYSIVQQNLRKIGECSDLHFRWNSLALKYQELWNNIYAEDAEGRLRGLLEKGAEISKSGLNLPNNEKMMLKWEEHVLRHRVPNYGSPATV
jgi:hypothetical protein